MKCAENCCEQKVYSSRGSQNSHGKITLNIDVNLAGRGKTLQGSFYLAWLTQYLNVQRIIASQKFATHWRLSDC